MKRFVFACALAGGLVGGLALAGSIPARAASDTAMQHGTAMGHDSMGHASTPKDSMGHSAMGHSAMGNSAMGHTAKTDQK